ncbi:helix-turn-helix domain-containing protein [Comamonas testosteroni]|uniref:helix-turn-helix domain-containing protein n=1 Tax=Comamonas testosteroni TaxID=285 RepID=UPI0011EF1FA6|nr:helix-turn-helix domain-containing protein [Comamonas testosteroni]
MHPEQIKAEIRMRGTTPAAMADKLCLSRMTVSNVIHGRSTSRRVADAIASLIEQPVNRIWPGQYEPHRTNKLKRGGQK